MLSKEAIDALRKQAQRDGMAYQRKLIEHIDALQAQLDKLQDDYTAQSLALKAAKAMQQAETERADANERDAERYRWIRGADSRSCENLLVKIASKNRDGWSYGTVIGISLDRAIDTAIATNHATIQPLSTKE